MKTSRNQMIERADEYRDRAQARRSRGQHAGRSAAGWDWKRPQAVAGSWDAICAVARDGWRSAVVEARNDFAVACLNGPKSDVYDFELI